MPSLAQATNYDLSGYQFVQKIDNPAAVPPVAQHYPEQPNRFLRAAVPQIGNASPDSQRSYYTGAVPQTRVPVLNVLGSPF